MKISCSQVNKLKEAYVDGMLDADLGSAIKSHTETCGLCASRVAVADQVKFKLGGAMKSTLGAPALSAVRKADTRGNITRRLGMTQIAARRYPLLATGLATVMLMASATFGVNQFDSLASFFDSFRPSLSNNDRPSIDVPIIDPTSTPEARHKVLHTSTPHPTEAHRTATPHPTEAHRTATSHPTEAHRTSTPHATEIRHTATPRPTEMHRTATPHPTKAHRTSTPHPTEIRRTATPHPTEIHRTPTP